MASQTDELLQRLNPVIEQTRQDLKNGIKPSEIANRLHSQGHFNIHLTLIVRHATQMPIRDIKGLGCWWGPDGVTDAEAFDEDFYRALRECAPPS